MKTTLNTVLSLALLSTAFSLTSALLSGCGQDTATENGLSCNETRSTITLGESTALGFSAQDALNNLEGSYEASLTWGDGTTTTLSLSIDDREGAVELVDQEVAESSSGQEMTSDAAMPMCEDFVSIPVTVTFATADGKFNESWALVMNVTQADQVSFYHEVLPTGFTGSYSLQLMDPADFDEVKVIFDLQFAPQTATGTVYEFGSKAEEGSDGVASATQEAVATWTTSLTEL